MPQLAAALNPAGTLILERSPRREEPDGTVPLPARPRYGKSEVAYYIA